MSVDAMTGECCLYLYGIVDRRPETERLLDAGDRLIRVGRVAALCRALDDGALSTLTAESGDGLLRLAEQHDAVLRRHAAVTTVLPVRLGTLYADSERVT